MSSQLALPGMLSDTLDTQWVWSEENLAMTSDSLGHDTVMKVEVVAALAPRAGGVYVDATLGRGGHTEALLEADEGAKVIAVDRDAVAIEASRERLRRFEDRVTLVHGNFASLPARLAALGIARVDGVCADLGVSSPQLDEPSRGLSFRHKGPIDMRMDPSQGETALDLIERFSDDELADVIFRYGEERRSRRIARSIKRAFADRELETTLDLRRAIVRAVGPARVGGVDPATRTFQALRIAVNRELDELQELLDALPEVLAVGGVAAMLSFHSLEDRLVKHAFLGAGWQKSTKKPIVPTDDERAHNPRSRSAKLRVARLVGDEGANLEDNAARFGGDEGEGT